MVCCPEMAPVGYCPSRPAILAGRDKYSPARQTVLMLMLGNRRLGLGVGYDDAGERSVACFSRSFLGLGLVQSFAVLCRRDDMMACGM